MLMYSIMGVISLALIYVWCYVFVYCLEVFEDLYVDSDKMTDAQFAFICIFEIFATAIICYASILSSFYTIIAVEHLL